MKVVSLFPLPILGQQELVVFTNEHLIYQMSLENSVEFSNVTVLDITEPEIKHSQSMFYYYNIISIAFLPPAES